MASEIVTTVLIFLSVVLVVARNCTCQMNKLYYVLANRSSECPLKYTVCNTLDFYVESSVDYFTNNTMFMFQQGVHAVENNLNRTVTETFNLILTSEGDEVAVIDCRGEFFLQFTFKYVVNVTLENLSFLNCSSPSHVHGTSVLGLANSTNIRLKFVKLLNPHGNGILLNNIFGQLILYGIDVVNGYTQTDALTSIYFTSCHQPSYVIISDSSFVNNRNKATDKGVESPYAGGLSITIKCFDAHVNIANVTFINNTGGDGGNLAILIHNMTSSHNIEHPIIISESLFHNGHGLVGGAIYILFRNSPGERYQVCKSKNFTIPYYHSLLLIENSNFSFNHAIRTGGAIFMKYHESLSSDCTVQRIIIKRCTFRSNYLKDIGSGGTAISSFSYIIPGYLHNNHLQTSISITDSIFKDNFVNVRHDEKDLSGSGVILAKSHKYFEMENVTIDSNRCSGVLALDSNIMIKGTVTIRNNTGYSGGGMLICQNAILYLEPRATLNIESNYANHSGGGILVESECSQSKPPCFYQLAAMDPREYDSIQINLINNTANYAGDQLFGGDVDYCYMIQLSTHSETFNNSLAVYQNIFHVDPNISISSHMRSSVTSIPRRVCFLQQTTTAVDINCTQKLPDQNSYPGEVFTIKVAIVGQMNGLVPGTVRTEFKYTQQGNSLETHQLIQRIDSNQSELTYTVYSNKSSVILLLAVQQSVDESVLIHIPKAEEVAVHVHLSECPLGFELGKNKPSCVCNKLFKSDAHILCNITNHSIYSPSQMWLGYYEDDWTTMVVLSKYCPLDYCKKTSVWIHTDRHDIDQDLQCRFNRTGLLCGQCPHGMSVSLSDSACRQNCSNYDLFKVILYLALEIVAIAILMFLNITITQGTISGMIFYANIVQIHKSIFFQSKALNPLKIFVSWINMESGISTCLYKGMDSYSKAWLQYTSPMYLWLLTGLIIYFSKKSSKIMRLVGKNAVKILATIILLSYTKLIQAIITSLHFLRLDVFNTSSGEISEIKRWYSDASVKYLEGKHIPLFIVGFFFGIICLGFTISLLCIQYLQKVSHYRLLFWVIKFKPLFDAYTGPFSFHGRFWTGLLLLMRLLLTIVTSLNFLGAEILNVLAAIIVLTILLVLGWIVRPGIYRKWNLDLLECSFLLNLLLLCIGTVFIVHIHSKSDIERVHFQQHLLTAISTSIAMVTTFGVIVYHTWHSVRDLSCSKRILSYCKCNLFKFDCYKNCIKENEEVNDRYFPPLAQFDSDREPLLVD